MRIARALTKSLPLWALAAALLAPLRLWSAQVTLAWDANTETDIAGYKVYYSSSAGNSFVDVGKVTSATVSNLSDATTYTFYATAYNSSGLESGPSSSITYTTAGATPVTPPPPDPTPVAITFTSHPQSQTIGIGNPLQLAVTVTGSQPITYQWYHNFAIIPSASGPSLQIPSVTTADGGIYFVAASNAVGQVMSRAATITVAQLSSVAPTIAASPTSQTVATGASLLLTVQAAGSSPLQYQWYRDGSPIPNATGTAYQIAAVQTSDAGSYTVRVSNSVGTVTSTPAVITVNPPVSSGIAPSVTAQPASKTVAAGTPLNLSVTATGTAPLNYQWFKNGAAIATATTSSFQIASAQTTDAGTYSVQISNSAGTVASSSAQVSVLFSPLITQQPAGQSVLSGSRVEFTVQASGSAPLQYQWYRDTVLVPDGTSATLVLASTTVSDSGAYTVTVSNPAGSATSFPAQLTVLPAPIIDPPQITGQPASQTVTPGTTVTFSVQATGTAPLLYQWFLNGTAISGATSSTLSVSAVQSINAGSYTVNVSNSAGTAKSSTAVLTVTGPPKITQQPQNQTVLLGSALDVTVQASGTPPLQYQWFRDNVAIPFATSPTYHVSSVRTTDAGSYSVNVANGSGSVSSTAALITVMSPPTISTQPIGQAVTAGNQLSLAVVASGAGTLSYQWFHNGTAIQDAISANLQISAAQQSDSGQYYVKVSNSAGSVNSFIVNVTVIVPVVAPAITTPPSAQTVALGSSLNLVVEVTGTAPMQFQWFRNGTPLPNGTAALLQITSAQVSDGGTYTVNIVNAAGSIASTPVLVTVLTPPVITQQPQAKSAVAGSSASFTVSASGSAPLTYQWLKNGIELPGQTASTLNIASAQGNDAGNYSVVISNGAGTATSTSAALTVTPAPTAPTIAVQPIGQAVASGSSLILTVGATGTAPLQYQWFKNGVVIPNAQNATFQITAAQVADSASYSVSVSNSAGSVSSTGAVVTVLDAPAIAQQPQSKSVISGSPLTLTVAASGSAPFTYQWFKNNTLFPNGTGATLDLGVADAIKAGDYYVKISNGIGSTNSTTATITVTAAPVAAAITIQPVDQTVPSGKPLTMSVGANGSTPLQYQWFRNGVLIQNANADTLKIDAPRTTDSGVYTVKVSNNAGSVTSMQSVITILDAPTITQQPLSKSVTAGSILNLAVSASGSAPLTYQWFKDDVAIPGATGSTLDLGAAEFSEAGRYNVAIANPVGNTNSTVATLQVTAAPVAAGIAVQPLDQTVPSGVPLLLSVVATGSTPLQYQWFRNGVAMQNANADTLRIEAPKTSDSAIYTVKISNNGGSVTSSGAVITVLDPISISQQPQSKSVIIGSAVNLTVLASGSAPLNYQWFKNGAPVAGGTSATLDLGSADSGDAAEYFVSISNPVGSTNSSTVNVQVTAAPVAAGVAVQPTDQTVPSGAPLILSVGATGSTPLQYQWFRNGVAIQNATAATFRIDAPKTTDSAIYSVKVSNSAGSTTSAGAVITVLDPLAVTQQPQAKSVIIGSALNLAVSVSGSAPITYQWYKDGNPVPGATSATLDLGTAQSSKAGDYYVAVTNPIGSTNSTIATVVVTTVPMAPSISAQPADQTVASGQPLALSITADGSSPLQYQWFRNGAMIQNATAATFRIVSPKTSDSAIYSVKVSNTAGSVTSANAVISVLDPLIISQQPQSKSVTIGSALNLSVTATGSAPITYQWYKDGVVLPGATSAILDLGSAQTSESGDYYVSISNPVASTNSAVATVQVISIPIAPGITSQPLDQTVPSGRPLSLSVVATGSTPLQYQWFRNGVAVQNANADVFRIDAPKTTDSALYTVKVSNSAGSITSAAAVVTVLDPPVMNQQPQSQTVALGAALSLSVFASGSVPVTFQWFKDGAQVLGATSATLDLGAAQTVEAGDYSVRVTNPVGSITSSIATVTVTGPVLSPSIAVQPVDQTISSANALNLSVSANGSAPLQYQWFRNGSPIQGANANTYQLASPRTTDSGSYSVSVSNSAGSVTSRSAAITVLDAPSILVQPQSKSVLAGSAVSLSVTASGSAPLTYQWLRGGTPISGATSASLNLGTADTADNGEYSVKISNPLGAVTSATASVTVTAAPVPPAITLQPTSQTIAPGGTASFSVQATGTAPLQYQWYRNGSAIPNATGTTLQIPAAQQTDAASYNVAVSNTAGSASSVPAVLNVDASLAAPVITIQPVGQNLSDGSFLSLSVQTTGVNLTYQWFHDGIPVPSQTTANYRVASVAAADAGAYNVRVSSAGGSVMSAIANVTVTTRATAPSITKAPVSQSVTLGSPITLSVQVTGSSPMQFQWSRNGRALQNGTSATLQILAAQASDAGDYAVSIANAGGSVASDPVTLSVVLPPVISEEPASKALTTGDSLTLSVVATSLNTMTYQWYKDGITVPNATGATLQISAVQKSNAGGYLVRVSNSAGTVTSSAATVTISDPTAVPTILTQPLSQALAVGSPLLLAVQASGTGPLQYQWYRNSLAIPNANSATFQKPAVGVADAASYTVKVSNSAGLVTSAAAVITVLDPPVITSAPTSKTVGQGSPLTLSVQATGAPTLTYRWLKNGVPITGANSASYQIASAATSDSGSYTVQVSNGDGSVTSTAAVLTVTGINGPSITKQPTSQTVLAGSDCTFIVESSGVGLQYQWYFNDAAVPNGTNALLRIVGVSPDNSGEYVVTISNSAGSVDSAPATLSVNSPPVITTQPLAQTVSAGAALTLRAAASGSNPLRYQWLRDGFVVTGATNATLQISAAKPSDAGNYVLRVSNDLASVNSQPAAVIVLLPPSIVTQPTSQTLTAGKAASFTVQAMGVGPLQYQWFVNGTPIQNATSATFQIASAQLSDAGIYTVQISNAGGSVTSDPAILGTSIANQFAISKQPLSQVLAVGSTLNLSVQISGGLALQYQWFRNGIAIGGATSPNLKIGSIQTSDAGSYTLRITSSAGILLSDPAVIRVVIPPGIIVQPSSQSVTAGSSVTLLVQATGSGPLQYQWSRDSVPLSDATGATLRIPAAQTSDAGTYSVRVFNEAGAVTSQDAIVSILVPPAITARPQSRSVAPGSALDLSVQATGSAPLLYQWFRNGVVIPNATSSTLHFDTVSRSDAASYAVSVANPAGMVTSEAAVVTVVAAPTITSPPERQVLPVGAPLLLTVGFTGSNPQFQWFRDALPLPGATNSILEIPDVDFQDQGAYRVTVSNEAGAVTSSPALIVVLAPPYILTQPLSLTLNQGSTATFAVLADGSDPLTYQWFRNGVEVTGATASSYSFNASIDNAGSYHVEVTNPLGTVSSVEVTLTVSNGDIVTPPAEPRVEITYAADADLVLQTIGEPGTIYDLQSSDQLPPVEWTTVSSAAAGTDGSVKFTATNPKVDSKFYRVVLHTE